MKIRSFHANLTTKVTLSSQDQRITLAKYGGTKKPNMFSSLKNDGWVVLENKIISKNIYNFYFHSIFYLVTFIVLSLVHF